VQPDVAEADIVVVDASSRPSLLSSLLATAGDGNPPLVVIATSADVESRALRLLLPEKQIVLKPVHGSALYEAFAAALGVEPAAGRAEPARAGPLEAHVLLVEDEAVNAAVAEGYLAALGCTSVWVESGAEAVARAGAEHFDLVLMDLNMPGMDGFEATALIRRQEARAGSARVPIVALTAHDANQYRERCLAADIDDILSKPYTLESCTRVLWHWLRRRDESAGTPSADTAASAATELTGVDAKVVAALRQMRGGREGDLYAKLVGLFETSSRESLAALETALARDDMPSVAAVAHKLSAAAGNVGALAYAKELKALERAARAGEREPAREIATRLTAAHASLLDALQALCLRAIA
jgi:CheY-like chemotaxis protein